MKPFNLFFTVVYYLGRALLSVLFPATVEGLDRLPRNGVLLCPNHSSNWDPILIALRLPVNYRLHIMAKVDLFKNPILAWILRRLGAFPVSRGSSDIQSVKTAMQAIRSGDNLLIFPEGTTIHNGSAMWTVCRPTPRAAWQRSASRTGATLVPVFVDGPKKPFHRTRIIFGEPYTPVYTGHHGTSEEMQKIADDILAAAYALGGQAVGGKPLCDE